jgi:hypothetical protein
MIWIVRIHALLLVVLLALVAMGCKKECPAGGGGACPAPQPAPPKGPINVSDILKGFEGGGSGKGTFTVPGLGDINVKVDCTEVTIQKDKPEVGTTQVDMKCSFDKWGLSGNATIKLRVDSDGKGSISCTGKADFVIYKQDINVYVDLNGGSQTGNTVTIDATANGQCFTATLTRDGDKITVEVSNPKTKIEINKK